MNLNDSRRRHSLLETNYFLQEKYKSRQANTDAQNQESASQIIQSNGNLVRWILFRFSFGETFRSSWQAIFHPEWRQSSFPEFHET